MVTSLEQVTIVLVFPDHRSMSIEQKATAFLAAAHEEHGATMLRPVPAARIALALGFEYTEAQQIIQELEHRQWAHLTGSWEVLGDVRVTLMPAGLDQISRLVQSSSR